ncbi:pollen receptor-like kinase 4 [Oryza glaberrima]|uniref:Protein kinase domain-containing protein n=1 Tax=Oryza glaberrima TaxID=4538 RepID=I1QK95_ORYGL|nr:pollen receptor-like kinase 4 [Oryza glaberrima]
MAGAPCLLRVLAVSSCLCLLADAARLLAAAPAEEADALLKLKAGIVDGGGALDTWAAGTSPCDGGTSAWAGVVCSKGSVLGLQLEKEGLSGELDLAPLKSLTGLRTLSFMDNEFAGAMPDVKGLGGLRAIFLSGNKFSGEIPADAFAGMGWLKKVSLSRNGFTGAIPASLAAVPRLLDLQLNDNKFTGKIPDFPQKDLKVFDVSNNELEGEIPASLKSIDPQMFEGNKKLCGAPVDAKCEAPSPPATTSPPAATSGKIGTSPSPPAAAETTTTGTVPAEEGTQGATKPTKGSTSFGVLAAFLGTLAIIGFAVVALQRRREYNTQNFGPAASTKPTLPSAPASPATKPTHAAAAATAAAATTGGGGARSSSVSGSTARGGGGKAGEQGRLTFVRDDDRGRFFELQDLLKASAEVLGAANLGVCYRAKLTGGHSVVVKRFKEMNRVGKEDFEEHMRRLGRLSHPNLLPLISYYYRKEEKLLIHDYVPNKSLAHLLHGEGRRVKKLVHWPARLKLVKGVARALQYLYDELPMLTVPHGHLKSSNILLNDRFEPLLTDYSLVPVMNQSHSAQLMVAFKSPERRQFGRSSKKSDVWCLGILILEILTGRPPSYDPPPQPEAATANGDLVGAVASTPEGEWLEKVVDADMIRKGEDEESKGEMVKLIKIGMACCEAAVDSRWELKTAVESIEELKGGKEEDANDEHSFYSSIDGDEFASVAIN